MKACLPILLLIAAPVVSQASYIHCWFEGKKLAAAGKSEEATGQFRRCFELAVEANDGNYAWPSSTAAAFGIYQQGRIVEAGEFALSALQQLERFDPASAESAVTVRTELLGIVDRGHSVAGRIGEGWRFSRLAAEVLRGGDPDLGGDAAALTVAEVEALQPGLLALGFRLLERQADYLDLSGRSGEALVLLQDASRAAAARGDSLSPIARFYAFKLRSRLVTQLDFAGDARGALDLSGEILDTTPATGQLRPSVLNLAINHQRNLSQWQGPSEELLAEARRLTGELSAINPLSRDDAEGLIARMEMDLRESPGSAKALAERLAGAVAKGHRFDELYAGRDLIEARSRLGEEIADAEFVKLLEKARAQGNKRAEPTLYRQFADELARQGRFAEAAPLYREALRLVRAFGLPWHQVPLLGRLLELAVEQDDPDAIRAVLAEIDSMLAANPDIPADRRVRLAVSRAMAAVSLGEPDEARAIFAQAREMAKELPPHQARWSDPAIERVVLSAPPIPAAAPASIDRGILLQPRAIHSTAVPGGGVRARVSLDNPHGIPLRGTLAAEGPGARVEKGRIAFEAGAPSATVTLGIDLAAGAGRTLELVAAAAPGAPDLAAVLRWLPGGPACDWRVTWEAEALDRTVLDASLLAADPFRSITFYHRVEAPLEGSAAFRMVSPVPLRFEYYDPRSGMLLAIDANGDGDFSGRGDLRSPGTDGPGAAWITAGADDFIEIRVFGLATPGPETGGGLEIEAQVHRDGEWRTEARDELR